MAVMIARERETITVPVWVTDLASFRRWTHLDEFPDDAKILYFDGNVMVDQSMERLLHSTIKAEIAASLSNWSREHVSGIVCVDSMRFINQNADLSVEPDVIFVTDESLTKGRASVEDGDDSLEIEGSPDIVVEIISPTSFTKDADILRKKFCEAGVSEYWLVDSRDTLEFTLLKRQGKRYVAVTPDAQGWLRSQVLGARCRLVRKPGVAGITRVTLQMKKT
ncbi:MAG: Uma2 family endonuclease [Gemmatales bacterium]